MERALSARFLAAALLALPLLGAKEPPPPAARDNGQVAWAEACKGDDGWDTPGPPFRVHGNTWYVGTCGIAAILINDESRVVVIDSGTEKGADVVLANLRSLGVDPKNVQLLLASHEHFDHVGGMARLIAATGADLFASGEAIAVMQTGKANRDDPQFGSLPPMQPTKWGIPYYAPETRGLLVDVMEITPIDTPGHTPGAMSWSWKSCEGADCKTIVYADSLSPVSSETYRFSDHPEYVAAFRESIAAIAALDCDILLTPHPSASAMPERARTGSMVGGMTCAQYADAKTKALDERLAREAAAK